MRLVVRGGLGHAGEGKRGMWHDKSAEKSHAGEEKMVCGMTRVPRIVMPERGKRYVA